MNKGAQRVDAKPCPECGGHRVLIPCDPRMEVKIGAFSYLHMSALACVECGYTSLYVNEPHKLKKTMNS